MAMLAEETLAVLAEEIMAVLVMVVLVMLIMAVLPIKTYATGFHVLFLFVTHIHHAKMLGLQATDNANRAGGYGTDLPLGVWEYQAPEKDLSAEAAREEAERAEFWAAKAQCVVDEAEQVKRCAARDALDAASNEREREQDLGNGVKGSRVGII